MRAFLAVEVDAGVRAPLATLTASLGQQGSAVHWVPDAARHLTIKFLAAVADETLAALQTELRFALATIAPLPAVARGIGVFPHWRRPRVVWAGVDCDGLAEVAARVDATAARLGLPPDTRPFAPHITLGRVQSPRGWSACAGALRVHAASEFGRWTIGALHAFQSDLRPGGAVYTKRWSIPFGA